MAKGKRFVDFGEFGFATSAVRLMRWIWELAPGGVIRAGKTAYTDDAHVGFWLGIDTADGLAKFNIGGATYYLKWTGAALQVAGDILGSTVTGTVSVSGGALTWAGGKGVADDTGISHTEDADNYFRLSKYTGVTAFLAINTTKTFTYGVFLRQANPALSTVPLYVQSDGGRAIVASGKTLGIESVTTGALANNYGVYARAIYPLACALYAYHHNGGTALKIGGGPVDGGSQRYTALADATADTDGLNRQTGDARYPLRSAGWTGTFATGDARTVTVVDGQITGVA